MPAPTRAPNPMPAPVSTGPHVGGTAFPSMAASILLVHSRGQRRQARALAQLISGSSAPRSLPSPLPSASAYLWPLQTRYFSASIWVVVCEDAPAAHEQLTHLSTRCGALVLLFDSANEASWEVLTAGWDGALQVDAAEIVLVVGEGEREEEQEEMEGSDLEGTALRRVEWCLDRSAEYVRADFFRESAQAALLAAAARGEGKLPRLDEDADGMVRVVEALQARRWEGASPAEIAGVGTTSAKAQQQQLQPLPPPTTGVTLPDSAVVAEVIGELPNVTLGGGALSLAEEEATTLESAEEAKQDRMEALMQQMSEMRHGRHNLPDTARREKAASLALELAHFLDDGDDEADLEEMEDGATKPSAPISIPVLSKPIAIPRPKSVGAAAGHAVPMDVETALEVGAATEEDNPTWTDEF